MSQESRRDVSRPSPTVPATFQTTRSNSIIYEIKVRFMLTLGVETSGRNSSVALLRQDRTLARISLEVEGRTQTNRLVSAVRELLEQQQVKPADINLLAVSRGPGSFTGLRIGLVFAKTFAYIQRCPLKGVDTFAAIVEQIPSTFPRVEVVEDLRQGYVASQGFHWRQTHWQAMSDIVAEKVTDWAERPKTGILLTGPSLDRLSRQLPGRAVPPDWNIAQPTWQTADAIAVAALGQRTFVETGADDPFLLSPLYVRRSAAEERADETS